MFLPDPPFFTNKIPASHIDSLWGNFGSHPKVKKDTNLRVLYRCPVQAYFALVDVFMSVPDVLVIMVADFLTGFNGIPDFAEFFLCFFFLAVQFDKVFFQSEHFYSKSMEGGGWEKDIKKPLNERLHINIIALPALS